MSFSVVGQDYSGTHSRWIVKVNGKQSFLSHVNAFRANKNLQVVLSPASSSKIAAIQSDDPDETQRWLGELLNSKAIEFFEPDYSGQAASTNDDLPTDPLFPQQWYLHNDGTLKIWNAIEGADINITEAWNVTQGDRNLVIAVLDSGVGLLEPDLEGRLWINNGEIPNDLIDNDQNGYVDDVNGYDFINQKSIPQDDNGHGTGIAGIIGAINNNQTGVSGINLQSRLMICKVLNNSLTGNYSNWIEGIHYAVDNGAGIINMSVTGKDDSKLLQEAIQYAYARGVAVFASMGNEKVDENRYPAAYTETIAVGSSNPDDQRSTSFNNSSQGGSNYGSHIDILAPGNFIQGLNRVPGGTTLWAGTSMSSAVACGVGSLLLSVDSELTPDELQSLLISTAKDEIGDYSEDTPGWDLYYGFGRIDAYRALEKLDKLNTENQFMLSIYPNPTQEKTLHVRLTLGNLDPVRLDIIDLQGKILKSMSGTPLNRTLSFSVSMQDYSEAMYMVKISTSRQVYLKRFILR